MRDITRLGIDLAKDVFQLKGINAKGETIFDRRLSRQKFLPFIMQLPDTTIVMEACGGANHWSRAFTKLGHKVEQISPQHVKPYVRGNKNDKNDVGGIVIASNQPGIPRVATKTLEQQDIQIIHREREHMMKERIATVNQIRGFLIEYGVFIKKGIFNVYRELVYILEDGSNELTHRARASIKRQYDRLKEIDKHLALLDREINEICKQSKACQRLLKLKGIGPVTASIIFATIGEAKQFKNGRHFAAFLGLVPKEHSSGNKQKLMGISKRGNTYIRNMLIHGGRAVVNAVKRKTDDYSLWIKRIKDERGYNKAAVAVANKNARHIWAMMALGEQYQNKLMVA